MEILSPIDCCEQEIFWKGTGGYNHEERHETQAIANKGSWHEVARSLAQYAQNVSNPIQEVMLKSGPEVLPPPESSHF